MAAGYKDVSVRRGPGFDLEGSHQKHYATDSSVSSSETVLAF